MTTGQSDVLVVPREPPIGNGTVSGSGKAEGDHKNTDSTGSTRSRKRVTFDLDLQVRTIPNRIPVYERRPAYYNNSGHLVRGGRTPQSYSLVPKPLDIRSRDRYLIGAANLSAKRIIDLFSVPNGLPTYPAPPRGQIRAGQPAWRRQAQGYGTASTSSAVRHPAYAYDGTKSAKMSRAAANLKQITAALGEHFDSSVYQEWDTTSTSAARKGVEGASESPDLNAGNGTCTTVSPTPARGFPPTKTRPYLPYRHQLSPKSISPTEASNEQSVDPSRSSLTRTLSYPLGTSPSTSTRKLPLVTDQIPMNESQLIISKAPSSQRPDVRRRSDGGFYPGSERFRRVPSALDRDRSERASSRCSTIDTYVISEPFESDNPTPPSSNRGPGARVGSGRRIVPSQGKARSVAWEGADIAVTEPALMANALRTSKPGMGSSNLGNPGHSTWNVSSKPVNR